MDCLRLSAEAYPADRIAGLALDVIGIFMELHGLADEPELAGLRAQVASVLNGRGVSIRQLRLCAQKDGALQVEVVGVDGEVVVQARLVGAGRSAGIKGEPG